MKYKISLMAAVAFAGLSFSGGAEAEGVSLAASTTRAPANYQVGIPSHALPGAKFVAAPGSTALLVKDVNPWNMTSNETVMNTNSIIFDKATCSEVATLPLAKYKLIIIASDQPQACYNALGPVMAAGGALDLYVKAGGKLQFNAADSGWQTGKWNFVLPGGSEHVTIPKTQNKVVLRGHPIAKTMPVSWTGNFASHGNFTRYPANAKTITGESPFPKVTTIEYCYGKGRVFSSTTTLEWGVVKGQAQGILLKNMIPYAHNVRGCYPTAVEGCVSYRGRPAALKTATLYQSGVVKGFARTDMQGCFSFPWKKIGNVGPVDVKIRVKK